MPAITRMLVPTDFSPASDIAFHYAVEMAAREGSAMHLLHVIDDSSFATAYPDGFYAELPTLRAQMIDEANGRLREMVATCSAAGLTATAEVVVGRPARAIAEIATTQGTDLVVMGTHGRGGFAHLLLGSVTERVIRAAPCAVLTVRDTTRIADAIASGADAVDRRQSTSPVR